MKTAIENGTVVNREGRCRANVVMEAGRIAYVGPSRVPADRVLDAAGCYVMAGFIDPHTHLELSPHPFGPDTEAALLGGTTCVLEFANQQAGRPMAEALAAWRAMAAGSACHYGIHMSVPWWDEGQAAQLAPVPLFLMGAAFCGVELTSAFPYFGFLAMLTGYDLAFPLVLGFIFLYDLMYMLPLILLYFGYNRLRGIGVIQRLEQALSPVSAYIVPVAISLLGTLLLSFGVLSVG